MATGPYFEYFFRPTTSTTGTYRDEDGRELYQRPVSPPLPSADYNRLVFLLNEIAARLDALGARLETLEKPPTQKSLIEAMQRAARRQRLQERGK